MEDRWSHWASRGRWPRGMAVGDRAMALVLPNGRHFKASEFTCIDGTPYPLAWKLRLAVLENMLDTIRDAFGSALRIVSGYRTPEHNMLLIAADLSKGAHNVASGSQHVQGRAADICPFSGPHELDRLWHVLKQLLADGKLPELGGYAMYPVSGWLHVDTRTKPADGHVATWTGV